MTPITFDRLPAATSEIIERLDSIERLLLRLPNNPLQGDKPITRKELCRFLDVSEPTVIRWERRGKIPVMYIGGSVRYDKADVLAALKKKGGNK
ncbi:MAG: DNA-binding protein [Chitinophagaceae bacterium]|nr:MAG: DNA-binding protein [Chitinophagaceae bacterium]